MRITKEMRIAGLPAIALRDALKNLAGWEWDITSFGAQLKIGDVEAQEAVGRLVAEELIEPTWCLEGKQHYTATNQGGRLALATAAKPITRRKADSLLAELLTRAEEINRDPTSHYKVIKISVFGSYLTDAPYLGDVDLFVELSAHPIELGTWKILELHEQTLRRLRDNSRALSIHPLSDLDALGVTPRDLYVYDGD